MNIQQIKQAIGEKRQLKLLAIKSDVSGNVYVDLGNKDVKGIIPRNQSTYITGNDNNVHKGFCYNLVGKMVDVVLEELFESEGKMAVRCDRKSIVEKKMKEIAKTIKMDDIVEGTIMDIQELGLFIDIGGDVQGLVPRKFIDVIKVDFGKDTLRVGDNVAVSVSSLIIENGEIKRIGFNRTIVEEKKVENLEDYFNSGDVVVGSVNGFAESGIFINLLDKFSAMAEYNGKHYNNDDVVKVRILNFNSTTRKIRVAII